MGQIQITISLVMIGLFTVAIMGFAINFAIDNNAAVSVLDDPEFSGLYTKTNSNLSGFREDSEDTYQSIIDTNIQADTNVAQNVGSFAITPTNVIGIVKNILEVSYIKIFGSNSGFSIFLTTLIGMIVFLIGIFLYKTLRGFPD